MTAILDEHDLGDCEKWDGYLCDVCRQEYQERVYDMEQQDWQDEVNNRYSLDNER